MSEKPIKIAEKQATQIANTKRKPKKGDLRISGDDHLEIYIE